MSGSYDYVGWPYPCLCIRRLCGWPLPCVPSRTFPSCPFPSRSFFPCWVDVYSGDAFSVARGIAYLGEDVGCCPSVGPRLSRSEDVDYKRNKSLLSPALSQAQEPSRVAQLWLAANDRSAINNALISGNEIGNPYWLYPLPSEKTGSVMWTHPALPPRHRNEINQSSLQIGHSTDVRAFRISLPLMVEVRSSPRKPSFHIFYLLPPYQASKSFPFLSPIRTYFRLELKRELVLREIAFWQGQTVRKEKLLPFLPS